MNQENANSRPETFSFTLRLGGEELQVSGSFPSPGSPVSSMVPLFLGLGDAMLSAAVREKETRGVNASCGPGCGACCRQLVPISLSEAAFLREVLIPDLPEEHRNRVEERIRKAAVDLAESGLANEIENLPSCTSPEARQATGLRYFIQSIPCPFLEEESCSIHPMRPLACREYLVTSPASRCARPQEGGIDPMKLPVTPSHTLIRMDAKATGTPGWVPMIAALTQPADSPSRTIDDPRSELMEFLQSLAGPPPA